MNGPLGKRLTALEEIAERARLRELRATLWEHIDRRARTAGRVLLPDAMDRAVDGAVRVAQLVESGLSITEAARHMAAVRGLDPDRVVAIFERLKSERGQTV